LEAAVPILPITPLRSSLPVVPAAKGELSALAMARTVLGQTAEVLGALAAQTVGTDGLPETLQSHPRADGGDDVGAKAAGSTPRSGDAPALDTPERAVGAAASRAALRQGGLAPLMADMGQALMKPETPTEVRQAINRVLALGQALQPDVGPRQVQAALNQSGLFLEARLAAGASRDLGSRANDGRSGLASPANDLKAALLVFRQVAQAWVNSTPSIEANSEGAGRLQGAASAPAAYSAASLGAAAATTTAASAALSPPDPDDLTPRQNLTAPGSNSEAVSRPVAPFEARTILSAERPPPTGVATAGSATGRLPEGASQRSAQVPASIDTVVAAPVEVELERGLAAGSERALPRTGGYPASGQAPTASTLEPRSAPPPYAGAPTFAQAAAQPGLPVDAAPHELARQLLQGAVAALARTELLQVASLPDAVAPGRAQEDAPARWLFDMPFMTPQGPAVAQFEISRDAGGGGDAGERATGRTWRARFSLDVEPMGPIHAQIALSGDRARVSLWAERPDGMARLRGEEASLQTALREASLEPELAFHPGSPQGPAPQPGRFVDRAT
jgi:hypothetical protein